MTMKLAYTGVAAILAASACGPAPTGSAPAPALSTPPGVAASADKVETRLGALSFERGYPTAETARKLFDEIDYQRAVQAYLWAYPAVSFESIRVATERDFNGGLNAMFIADKFADAKSIFLTANDTTIYAYTNVDLGKSGPIVVDVPPGRIVGLIDDFWQRSLADVGLPGPYGDKGGKFLMLPPGYKGDVPKDGYQVLQGTMNNYNIMVRGIVTGMHDAAAAAETVKKLQVYPWSERSKPKATTYASFSGRNIDTLPPAGIEYWARLSTVVNNNPVHERDRFFMAMLKPLGIEKGKPFSPDARQRTILEDAARIGDAMGRTMLFEGDQRIAGANAFSGTNWNWVVLNRADQETEHYSQLDERLHYTYGAIYTSPNIGSKKPGPGSEYVQAFKDKDGNHLDGGKSYRLRVPANVPAGAFWSLTLYDTTIRSQVVNTSGDAARSSYDKLKTNADGSIDFYFGPKAPAGEEANWIETVPGKGFYPMFRFYTPMPGVFDGTWKLPDVEVIK
jgi:hypothetical protein